MDFFINRYALRIISFIFLLIILIIPSWAKPTSAFIDSQICAQCHQTEYQEWKNSHHALAMQIANTNTVLGNFNNFSYDQFGFNTRFFKKQDKYYINTQNADGKYVDFQVKYTFGIDPLQQYLLEFPNGHLQAFAIAWDTHKKQWFHLSPQENMNPHDSLFWGKRFYNWNFSCADCHSTHVDKNYDATTKSYNSTWSAINVDCQACHGPAKEHIVWAKAKVMGKNLNIPNRGLLINYQTLTAKQFVETCAFCHSRRHAINPKPNYGTPLLDNYVPEILREHIYHADGSIEAEDYEYGSFIQSKMYKAGVVCSNCHNPHSGKIKIAGNGLCTQCHNAQSPKPRFKELPAKKYDSPTHTHHLINSLGSQCKSCHMPSKTYMDIDVRHDHYFRIPRPDLTIKYGIPNACNLCHQHKSPQWAQQAIERWFGKLKFSNEQVDAIENGREYKSIAQDQLIQLAKDEKQSAVVKATAAYLLQYYQSAPSEQVLINLTKDNDSMVRTYAVASLQGLSADKKALILTPLLLDPILAVRIEAARILTTLPKNLLNSKHQQLLAKTLAEYIQSQQAVSDTPEANLNLAVLAETQNNYQLAEKYYTEALQLDKNFYPAAQNLAILYNSQGQSDKAEKVLRQGIANNKDQGELYYSLGLLLAEENKYEESILALAAAAKLMPNNAKIYYNYGLMLQHLNRYQEAENALLKSHELNSSDPNTLYALSVLFSQQQQWDKAENYAKLLQINLPNSQKTQELLQFIKNKGG